MLPSSEPSRRDQEHWAAGVDSDVVGLGYLPCGEGLGDVWRLFWCCESHVELALQVGLREVAVELGFAFVK